MSRMFFFMFLLISFFHEDDALLQPHPSLLFWTDKVDNIDVLNDRDHIRVQIDIPNLRVEDLSLNENFLPRTHFLCDHHNHLYIPPGSISPFPSEKNNNLRKLPLSNETLSETLMHPRNDVLLYFKTPHALPDGGSVLLTDLDNVIGGTFEVLNRSGRLFTILVTDSVQSSGRISKRAADDPVDTGVISNRFGCVLLRTAAPALRFGSDSVELGAEVVQSASDCQPNANQTTVSMTWSDVKHAESIDLQTVNLSVTYERVNSAWKQHLSVHLKGKVHGNDIDQLFPLESDVHVPTGFSYVCSRAVYKVSKRAEASPVSFVLVLNQLQTEPFVGESVEGFSRAWDCAAFFSVPIWSGIFVSLIMLAVLMWSIAMLAPVPSMDKWDNARGQALQFSTSE